MISNKPLFLALLAAPLLGAESCGSDLLSDPGFDIWCGEELCSWEVEQGTVEKVPTWHESDSGALLVGEVVVLSQLTETTSSDADCIQFSLIADQDDDVGLSLQLDFYDDGVTDYSHPLVADDWQRVDYRITPPDSYDGIRFRVQKVGAGDAVIAHVRAQDVPSTECTDPPIDLGELPHGAECSSDNDCIDHCAPVPVLASEGESVVESFCSECDSDAHCDEGETCALVWGDDLYGTRECREAGTKSLGEACAEHAECASALCNDYQCSECHDSLGCEDGTCARADTAEGTDLLPHQCDPGVGDREAGADCLKDADCASGSCEAGTDLKICDPDGRSCQTDDDCPWAELGGTCETVGRKDGICG